MFKILSVVAMATAALAGNARPRDVYEAAFADHIAQFKVEIKNGKEFVARLQAFADNYDLIEAHNADPKATYKMALNKFSHLTLDEFHSAVNLGGIKKPSVRKNAKIHTAPSVKSADSVDWSTTPAVTPVKNQGNCGSCWSFSTTGGLEGAYYLAHGTGTSLSEQNLVSCDGVDQGCNGGWMDDAFAWTKKNGGLCAEADYPYTSGTTGTDGTCETSCSIVSGSAPSSWTDVQAGSVSAMESAVAQQPVSIAIQANQVAFQSYSSGVLTGRCGQNLDHGVLAVGYGTLDGVDYWKVKNSWGPDWGEDGYILIERSSADLCGVLDAASYPTI